MNCKLLKTRWLDFFYFIFLKKLIDYCRSLQFQWKKNLFTKITWSSMLHNHRKFPTLVGFQRCLSLCQLVLLYFHYRLRIHLKTWPMEMLIKWIMHPWCFCAQFRFFLCLIHHQQERMLAQVRNWQSRIQLCLSSCRCHPIIKINCHWDIQCFRWCQTSAIEIDMISVAWWKWNSRPKERLII